MSQVAANKYLPHLFIIPEDDANRQIAIGFEKDHRVRARSLQVVTPAGGWSKAIEKLYSEYIPILNANANSHVLLIIDCDDDSSRIETALEAIPAPLKDRVFMLGTLHEPEALKADLRLGLEKVGETMANQCFDTHAEFWEHAHLRHNKSELARLKSTLFNAIFDV